MKNILLFIVLIALSASAQVDQRAYYKALESEELAILDSKISELNKMKSTTLIRAYKGALIAKKASFLKGMKDKLDTFKEGVELLESAIEKYPNKTEFRFLRLSVQENCPKFLKYNSNIEEDKRIIESKFSRLDNQLQQIITDYARTSEILNVTKLK